MFFVFISFSLSKQYDIGKEIRVYGNKITPYNNPFESYDFYSLPFCPYTGKNHTVKTSMGDAFLGNRFVKTNVTIYFRNDIINQKQCKKTLTDEELDAFRQAVHNQYIFQYVIEKLPVWGRVGTVAQDNSTFVFTKWHFALSYSGRRVSKADITPGLPVNIDDDNNNLTFSYSVSWTEANIQKYERYDKYAQQNVGNKVHYASLFNVVIIVLCVVMFTICLILRALNNDLNRYEKDSKMGDFDIDFHVEKGWKMLHADVFRKPPHEEFLASLIGTGAHVATTAILFTFFNFLFGNMFSKSIKINVAFGMYALSGFVSGYVSGGLYKRWGGVHWIRHLVLQTFALPAVYVLTEIILSFVALTYGSTQATRAKSLITVVCVVVFLVFPLTVFGGILGRNWFLIGQPPTQPSLIRRKIPQQPIYLTLPILMIIVGLVGSVSILLELQYILTALLQYNFAYVWGFLMITIVLLFIVVGSCAICTTYYRLGAENYEWQWSSFITSFSVGIYAFVYCLFYLSTKTSMTGTLQIAYFISYSFILCSVLGIICGFVGFISAAFFVRNVYKNLKTD